MGLIGQGAVAIWHDLAQHGRPVFYDWHGKEHMRERVAIPGFRRGRRYIAIDADLEFFNLYEADSVAILAGPEYQDRLNSPTKRTSEVVMSYSRVARSICRVAATCGAGQGGLISTWRYDVGDDDAAAHIETLRNQILPDIAASGLVAGAHLLVADQATSAIDTAERQARAEPNQVPRWVVMVESWADETSFANLCSAALPDALLRSAGATSPPDVGLYRLQATISEPDLNTEVLGH